MGFLDSLEHAFGFGYSSDDVQSHIDQGTAAADQAGYDQEDINGFLGFADPTKFMQTAKATWASLMGSDPAVLDSVASGKPDLTQAPYRQAYADALNKDEVKGPQDFADNYAAAMVGAAHDDHGLDNQDGDLHLAEASQAANTLAPTLPTHNDVAAAAVAVNPDDPKTARQKLLDHWVDTGMNPVEAAVLANRDPTLADKLTGTVVAPQPTLDELSSPARDAIEKFYWVPGEELPDAKTVGQAIEDLGGDVATVAGLNLAGKYIVAPLARAAIRKLGELPEWLGELANKTTIDSVDLTKPPGRAISEVSVSDAMRAPQPATIRPVEVAEGATPAKGAPTVEFAPESAPAERIAAIAKQAEDTGDRSLNSGTFFQDKLAEMGETDPATLGLARGHDNVAAIRRWLWDVWSDESGSGPGFAPTELERGSTAARDAGRDYGEDLIRRISTGLGTQKTEYIAQAAEAFFKDISPFIPRFRQEIAKPFGGDWANTEVGKFINAVEGQGTVQPDSPLYPLFKFMLDVNDKHKADINARVAAGDMNPVQYREHYLAHLYTPESINVVNQGRGVAGRQGSLGFTKQRSQPTYADAIGEGYKPLHDNPILTMLHGLDASKKALDTVEMQGIARDANWMRYYTDQREAARDGFRPLAGLNSEKLAADKEGNVIRQQLYAREGLDTIWNNWAGFENLQRGRVFATAEDALLKIKNTSTYLKLALPLYHTATMYKEGWSNAWANALTELTHGISHLDPLELARGMWDTATVPVAPITYPLKAGLKWRPMYRAMEADPALDAFVGGGGTIAARNKVYQGGTTPTLWRSWRRGTLTQELLDDLRKSLTAPATRAGESYGPLKDLSNLAALPFREIGRVTTSLSAPIWDHLIPLMKSGAAIQRIQTFIRQNPDAADEVVRDYGRRVVTNIEDRFGEYNSANLFWRPAIKRIANQVMLSTGWAYGTIHATLQGMGFNPSRGGMNPLAHLEWNPVATTNLAANLGMIAFTNAAWSYLIDGKMPDNKLDYMIPFANARGIARMLIPGEEKEYYDWMKIAAETFSTYTDKGIGSGVLQAFRSTGNYALGKLAPPYQAVKDWMAGEYFNTKGKMVKIVPTPAGMQDWLKNEFLPIFVNSWDKNAAAGLNAVENLFGMREAPKWFENWDAWRQGQVKLHDQWTKADLKRAAASAQEGYANSVTAAKTTRNGARTSFAQRQEKLLEEGHKEYQEQRQQRPTYLPASRGRQTAAYPAEQTIYPGNSYQQPTTILRGNQTAVTRAPVTAPRSPAQTRAIRSYYARRGR